MLANARCMPRSRWFKQLVRWWCDDRTPGGTTAFAAATAAPAPVTPCAASPTAATTTHPPFCRCPTATSPSYLETDDGCNAAARWSLGA